MSQSKVEIIHLLSGRSVEPRDEQFTELFHSPHVKIEQIISRRHATPPDHWYDQDEDELVVLLAGSAGMTIDGHDGLLVLGPGDAILLPAHRRHRVEWTDPAGDTVWLAIHITRDSHAAA